MLKKSAQLFAWLVLPALAAASEDEFASVRDALQTCVACHGERGAAPQFPQYPIIAGQHYYYLYLQLRDFKTGARKNELMQPFVDPLDTDDLKLIAKYFSQQAWPVTAHVSDPKNVEKARSAVDSGECVSCHLGDFRGNSGVPRLSGQRREYLEKTMLDFKNRVRTNSPDKAALLATFSADSIEALADYLASVRVQQVSRGVETH